MMAQNATCVSVSKAGAIRALQQELKLLHKEPVEGFVVRLADESNLFEWEVAIYGSPGTLYEGGYFKARIIFPQDYPYSPPTVKFLCKMWHPNVYESGEVCISILHPPVDDPQSGELPCERWNPTQNVRTILLSIISLLNEPNISSPANVDASVAFRRWKESRGKDTVYEDIVRKQVRDSILEAQKDGVVVPVTVQDYCVTTAQPKLEQQTSSDFDFYDDYTADADDSDGDIACSVSDIRKGESRCGNA